MNKPFDIKYLVLSDHPQEGSHEYFDTHDEAVTYITTVLIPAAEHQYDVEGYPRWITEIMVCSIIGDVVQTPDGLKVQKRA